MNWSMGGVLNWQLSLACALSLLAPCAAYASGCDGTALPAGAGYRTANGQFYAPNGTPFVAHGIDITTNDLNANSLARIRSQFPGLNQVRVPVFDYQNPVDLAAGVQAFTSAGIVVVLEHHVGAGGGNFPIPTGGDLAADLSWYQALGATYANNPLVWSASTNEPPAGDIPALTVWQQQEYQAFRQGGATSPFGFELQNWSYGQGANGTTDPSSANYNTPTNAYANTTNAFIDIHAYPWITAKTPDANSIANFWATAAQAAQARTQSKDGTMPVWFGELGPADDSNAAGGNALVNYIQNSGYGYAGWYYAHDDGGDALLNADGSLSDYGKSLANGMGSTTLCPTAPPPPGKVPGAPPPGSFYESTTLPIIRGPTPEELDQTQQNQNDIDRQTDEVNNLPIARTVDPFQSTNNGFTAPILNNPNAPFVGTLQPFVSTLTNPVLTDFGPPIQGGPPVLTKIANTVAGHLPMISPIGTFLTYFDGALITGADTYLQSRMPAIVGPLASLCALALGMRGYRIAQGDQQGAMGLGALCAKIVVIVALATNLGNFDYYVRDFFYNSIPTWMMPGGHYAGTLGVGSSLDHMWALSWQEIAKVWTGASIWDVASRCAAILCALTINLALCVMAIVMFLARGLLMVILVLGPYAISCLLFEQSKPIFERWMGKVVALIIMQVACAIVMTMLLAGDTYFMTQIQPALAATGGAALGSSGATVPTIGTDIEALVAMAIWFCMGAFWIVSIPAVAYSIGTGVAANIVPLAMAAVGSAASMGMSLAAGAVGMSLGAAAGGALGALEMGFSDEQESTSSNGFYLPSEPPPGIESMT